MLLRRRGIRGGRVVPMGNRDRAKMAQPFWARYCSKGCQPFSHWDLRAGGDERHRLLGGRSRSKKWAETHFGEM